MGMRTAEDSSERQRVELLERRAGGVPDSQFGDPPHGAPGDPDPYGQQLPFDPGGTAPYLEIEERDEPSWLPSV